MITHPLYGLLETTCLSSGSFLTAFALIHTGDLSSIFISLGEPKGENTITYTQVTKYLTFPLVNTSFCKMASNVKNVLLMTALKLAPPEILFWFLQFI